MSLRLLVSACVAAASTSLLADVASAQEISVHDQESPAETTDTSLFQLKGVLELGFLAPLKHTIQFSNSGTRFNYIRQGGQDNLFFAARLSAELAVHGRHSIIFLYQPLDLRTSVLLRRDLRVDDHLFPAGTPMDLRYGFDFYRTSYLYDFYDNQERQLAIGASLQLRNATIDFTSADGTMRRTNRDIGPVPALKVRGRMPLGDRMWVGAEADGMYAPVKYFNGGRSDVVGAILDASVRAGVALRSGTDVFVNLRYLGGGATGTSKDKSGPGDGYTDNWLHFFFVTLGLSHSVWGAS